MYENAPDGQNSTERADDLIVAGNDAEILTDGGEPTANLLESVETYLSDLEDHVADLIDLLDGNDEGYAMFALDAIEEAKLELRRIDLEEADDV